MPAVPPDADDDTSSDDAKQPSTAAQTEGGPDSGHDADQKRLTVLQTVVAVAAALFGVRSRAGFRRDMTRGSAPNFILAGLILFLLFCVILWILVHFLVVYQLHQQGISSPPASVTPMERSRP